MISLIMLYICIMHELHCLVKGCDTHVFNLLLSFYIYVYTNHHIMDFKKRYFILEVQNSECFKTNSFIFNN